MQTDKLAFARAVRRRMADTKMADDLRSRGWTGITPPADDVQEALERGAAK